MIGQTVLLASMAALAMGASAPVQRTIPAQFVGDWASSADRCNPGTFDSSNVRVTARSFEDLNGRVKVKRVAIVGPDAVQVAGRIEGVDGLRSVPLALADEGRTLLVGAEEDTSNYIRCAP